MSRLIRMTAAAALATLTATAAGVVNAPYAAAACHQFRITAVSSTVQEGASLAIRVTRDSAINPSSIQVSSADQTARAGSDYTPVNSTVRFTAETTQTIMVATTQDAVSEESETFVLRLSNPAGCPVNTRFDVGPPVTVTIADNDTAAPAPAPTTAAPTTAAPPRAVAAPITPVTRSTTTAVTAPAAPTATTTTVAAAVAVAGEETSTTTSLPGEMAIDEVGSSDDGGPNKGVLAVAGLGLLGAIAGAATLLNRSRRGSPTP